MTKAAASPALIDYKLLLIIALSVLLPLPLQASSPTSDTPPNTEDRRAIAIKTIILGKEKPKLYRSFSSTSRAAHRVSVRSQVAGRLLERTVGLGDEVEKGAVLARLYNPEATPLALEAKQQWKQSQVQAAQRRRDFQRMESLYDSGAATKQEFENARTNLWGAETAQSAAKSRYQRASQVNEEQLIRAPFKGVITQVNIEEGEVINIGQPLMQLADPEKVEAEVTVSERIASTLQKGDTVHITLPLQNSTRALEGRVQEITPFRERGALPTVVIALPGESVKPGMTAHIHFSYSDNSQFALPLSAVVKTGAFGSAVYRVTAQNNVELVPIRPHQLISSHVTVSGDLQQQDQIVISGVQQLFNGAPVQVVKNNALPILSALESE